MDAEQLKKFLIEANCMVEQLGLPPDNLFVELRSYLNVAHLFPQLLDVQRPETVQQAQNGLAAVEARLDRVVAIQFDVAMKLQSYSAVVQRVRKKLLDDKILTIKSTGPQTDAQLLQVVPKVLQGRDKWRLLEQLCGFVQKRMQEIKNTVKLQEALDSNVRWSRHRT